jgi:FkbM family methyltransferase
LVTEWFKNASFNQFETSVYARLPLQVRCNSEGVSYHLRGNSGEPDVERYIQSTLKPDSIFFDLGANYGVYTILAADICTNGQVHSFEPQEALFNCIKDSLALNAATNVTLNQMVVANSLGELTFYETKDEDLAGYSSLYSHDWIDGKTITVQATTLDYYIQEHSIQHIDLIKIDVEGAEHDVIQGAEQALESKVIKSLIIEITPPERVWEHGEVKGNASSAREAASLVFKTLTTCGYSPRFVQDPNSEIKLSDLPSKRSADIIFVLDE